MGYWLEFHEQFDAGKIVTMQSQELVLQCVSGVREGGLHDKGIERVLRKRGMSRVLLPIQNVDGRVGYRLEAFQAHPPIAISFTALQEGENIFMTVCQLTNDSSQKITANLLNEGKIRVGRNDALVDELRRERESYSKYVDNAREIAKKFNAELASVYGAMLYRESILATDQNVSFTEATMHAMLEYNLLTA